MPKYFERCPDAMELADIKPGMKIWHVTGIYPPEIGVKEVASEPMAFRDHHEYQKIHENLAAAIVFDTRYVNDPQVGDLKVRRFASDLGLMENQDNDNYVFDSLEKAEAGRDWIAAQYETYPDIKSAEMRRQTWLQSRMDAIGSGMGLSAEHYSFEQLPRRERTPEKLPENSLLKRMMDLSSDRVPERVMFSIAPKVEPKPDEDETDSRPL